MSYTPPETGKFAEARTFAKRQKELLRFSSEELARAKPYYVAWLDLMGSGHVMSVSVQKSANFIVRLHMAVERAARATRFSGMRLPINDGIYIVSEHKAEIVAMVQATMVFMSSLFIATPRPHDRFLMRGALAFGPIHTGENLKVGVGSNRMKANEGFLRNVMFGPPIIQAYLSESSAPPYGIAIHESARSFAETDQAPFQMTHWLWWQRHAEAGGRRAQSYANLKAALHSDLKVHFEWMQETLLFHGLAAEKVRGWSTSCDQYFHLG